MNRLIKFIFSMSFMTILIFIFFSSIGIATFIEKGYDTTTAKFFIYNSKWFEWVLFFLFINLIYNLFRYKLFLLKKIGSLTFHLSFLIIVVGAFITRNVSYEGLMSIREGSASNQILTSETYLQIRVDDQVKQYSHDIPVSFSGPLNQAKNDFHNSLSSFGLGGLTSNHVDFSTEFNFPDESKSIQIEYYDFLPKYYEIDTFDIVEQGDAYLHLVTVGTKGRKNNYIGEGMQLVDNEVVISVNKQLDIASITLWMSDSGEFIQSPFDINYMQMSDQSQGVIKRDSLVPFLPMRLYSLNGVQFVYKQKIRNAILLKEGLINHAEGVNTLQLKVKEGEEEEIVNLIGGQGIFPKFSKLTMNGLNYHLCFGSKLIELPFFIHLKDFELEKYPGTDNPSSYASEVSLVDTINKVQFDHRIFMNNVLDYSGYRFFQSSFDPDEQGTILSVNHDWWGTKITYLGYILMALGMILSIFTKGGRFNYLLSKAKDVRLKREALMLILSLFLLMPLNSQALNPDSIDYSPVNVNHADAFGELIIQNFDGRLMPAQTMADMVLRKVSRSTSYNGMNAMQVFIGLHTDFAHWFNAPLIYVTGDSTRRLLGIEGKRAAMSDFYDENTSYKLSTIAKAAIQKSPNSRNAFEKDFIKTDERFNVIRGVVMGYWLKIFPMKNDPTNTWYAPADNLNKLTGADSSFVSGIMTLYMYEVHEARISENWAGADSVITLINRYQQGVGDSKILPSSTKVKLEILSNKMDVFNRLTMYYLFLGLIILIAQFVNLFRPNVKVNIINKIGLILFIILLVFHGFNLGLRWYLSGHAPWSNGYEAVVFIAFVVGIAGLIFSKNTKIILGATGIFAWLLLFVAGLNNMDPQMSNLVPVLKSYWLMIHVAIITGSYAFLGLSAVLGIINFFIEIFKTKLSKKRLGLTAKELRHISEVILTIGLFMLTIGTFLGGVWANESWGRYWGWDAKETWALVSVLIYSVILHLRFIPGLKSDYVFNLGSIWGYGSIIMTFYGVNFYLSGLHSYATGDPVPIPAWVPITVISFIVLSVLAYIRKRRVL